MTQNQSNNVESISFNIYLAGFLDADGSIYVRAKPNSSYKYGYQIAPTIAFFQSKKSKEFPTLCRRIKYGSLRIRKDGIYEYTISKQEEIKSFLSQVLPFLVLKQEQAKLMITILDAKKKVHTKNDFEKLLTYIDCYRILNYSKKRKIHALTP